MLALLQPDGTITLKPMEFGLGSWDSGENDRKPQQETYSFNADSR